MDVCHLLLGRPWQYERHVIYDGFKNTYAFNKDGHKIILAPLKSIMPLESKNEKGSVILNKVELDKEVKGGCNVLEKSPDVIRPILTKFDDVVQDEIPLNLPSMGISNTILIWFWVQCCLINLFIG